MIDVGTCRILIPILWIFVSAASAQPGCEKLDKDRPSAYIAFEKEITETVKGKPQKITLLKLRNNTSCEIAVETDGQRWNDENLYGVETAKDASGKTVTRYTQRQVDNVRQVVFYDVRSSEKSAWAPANYFADRDLSYHFTIFPGFSVIFPVERKHAQKPFRLAVKFSFEWEVTTFENTDHRTFYWLELPKGFDESSSN